MNVQLNCKDLWERNNQRSLAGDPLVEPSNDHGIRITRETFANGKAFYVVYDGAGDRLWMDLTWNDILYWFEAHGYEVPLPV